MVEIEELYHYFQEKNNCSVTYEDGLLTITLSSRGEARICGQRTQLLIRGKVYDEFDWDEEDDIDDLVLIVENFAAHLERMGRDGNATYRAASESASSRSIWGFIFMLLGGLICMVMMGRTGDARWLATLFIWPLVAITLLVMILRSTFSRYWVCPQCAKPLPLIRRKLLPRMEYTARCPKCGYDLEQIVSVEQLRDEELCAASAPSVSVSLWPARICGWVGVAFAAFMALLVVVDWEAGNDIGVALGLVVLILCLVVNLQLLLRRAPSLTESLQPMVVVRESRPVVWVGIFLWLIGIALVFGGTAVALATPQEAEYVVFMGGTGLVSQFTGVWMLLACCNRVLYIWDEPSLACVVYISSWGRLRRFETRRIASTLLTFNSAIHLLDENGKKLASVETNMYGVGRLLDWLEMRDLLPTMSEAMQKQAEQKGVAEPTTVAWREEYRTRWHSHLKAIRAGMWAAIILLGIGGVLPAVLYLKGVLKFTAMIRLLTLAPLLFLLFCFIFSPVLLFGSRPKGATEEWNAMHIKVPVGWLFLCALIYWEQIDNLWSRWILQIAEDGWNWVGQAMLLVVVLTVLFALATPRRLRRDSTLIMGFLLLSFSFPIVYGVNLMLSGPALHSPLVILDSHAADPEVKGDEHTLTVRLKDGCETEMYVFDFDYDAAMSGEELVLCSKESPLGITFVDIHRPETEYREENAMTISDFTKEVEENETEMLMGGKLVNLNLEPVLAYGRMRALFGEPNYESQNFEMAYTYILSCQPGSSQKVYLHVYEGSGGPAIGGQYDERSQQAAEALKKLLESSDEVVDYQYEGYYPDAGVKIWMGIENGVPYFREERCDEIPDIL